MPDTNDTHTKTCHKCGHKWFPRHPGIKPVQCPRCKTYKWEPSNAPDTELDDDVTMCERRNMWQSGREEE